MLRRVGAEEDVHGFGPSTVPRRVLSRVVRTKACTTGNENTRGIVVVRIAGGRGHSRVTGGGTRVVKDRNSPFCNTPTVLVILKGGS